MSIVIYGGFDIKATDRITKEVRELHAIMPYDASLNRIKQQAYREGCTYITHTIEPVEMELSY